MPVTLQSLDVTVLVIPRHVLTETVRVRADTCCFAIGGIQHPVQSVVGELVAADGAFIPGLPGHAADVTVVAGGTHTRIVVQVLGEARTCDARQPAAEVSGKLWSEAYSCTNGRRLPGKHRGFLPLFQETYGYDTI